MTKEQEKTYRFVAKTYGIWYRAYGVVWFFISFVMAWVAIGSTFLITLLLWFEYEELFPFILIFCVLFVNIGSFFVFRERYLWNFKRRRWEAPKAQEQKDDNKLFSWKEDDKTWYADQSEKYDNSQNPIW